MNMGNLWILVLVTQILCNSVEGILRKKTPTPLTYLAFCLLVCLFVFLKGKKKKILQLMVHFRE